MNDYLFWLASRAIGLTAFAALSVAVISGVALRTSVLDFLATNRALRRLHDFATPLWLPLGIGHALLLVVDRTARIDARDLLVPFQTPYGQLAIGLGTVGFDLVLVVVLTSWLKKWMHQGLWRWLHRTSYLAFGAIFLHAALSGTDFDAPLVSALAWSSAAAVAVLIVSRLLWGRLPS